MNDEQRAFIERIILLAKRTGNWQMQRDLPWMAEKCATEKDFAKTILERERMK